MKNAANDLKAAQETRSEAFTRYFPSVSAAGSGFIADKGLLQNVTFTRDGDVDDEEWSHRRCIGYPALFTGGQLVNGNNWRKPE